MANTYTPENLPKETVTTAEVASDTLEVVDIIPVPPKKDFTIKTTSYSSYGDTITDSNTAAGRSSTGQNLTPGILAVSADLESQFPIGTILENQNGEVFIVADRSGVSNSLDRYYDKQSYNDSYTSYGSSYSKIGYVSKVPNNEQGVRDLLSQYGTPPSGNSYNEDANGVASNAQRPSGSDSYAESKPNPNNQPGASGPIKTVGGAGSARGMFSIPTDGAKVWVFFHGGDIQRPIYFASCPDPDTIKAAYQAGSAETKHNDDKNSIVNTHSLQTIDSGITFTDIHKTDGDGSLPYSQSYANLQCGSNIKLGVDKVESYTAGSTTFETGLLVHNNDEVVSYTGGGGSHYNNIGTLLYLVGNHTTEAVKASEQIQSDVNAVHQAQSDAIKNTTASKIECPICAQKYLVDKSTFVKKIVLFLAKILNMLPWNCWNWPVTQFLMNMVVVPFLSEISGLVASGGKGCGACKDGQLDSPRDKVDAGNQAASKELKNRQSSIDTASKKLPESPLIFYNTHDIYLKAGLARNNAKAYNDTGCKNSIVNTTVKSSNSSIQPDACKNTPNIVEAAAVTKTFGNITLDSANDIKLIAGSTGIDIGTQGPYKLGAGGIEMTASDGPANISSNNVTTISGKTIVLQDKDDGGIRLQSNNVSLGGAQHVTGDQFVRGTSTSDAIATKHLIMPSMRSETTMSSSPKSVTDGATWYLEGSLVVTIKEIARNVLLRDLKSGWIMTPSGIMTITQEMYNLIMSAIPIHVTPIGFCVSIAGIYPVFGFRHTHTLPAQDHAHQITLPKGNYYNDTEAWHQARPETSSVPTPAPGQGDGYSPGPKSSGGCGGGGAGFGDSNSAVSQNRKTRNASVGLSDGDYNYSRITIDGTGWIYDEDGNIIPTPEIGLTANCQ